MDGKMSTKVVFVPGSCHSPACFGKVMEELKLAGYKCTGVELITVGDGASHKTLEDDTARVRTAVNEAIGDVGRVVLVCHSYGGVPGNNALEGLGIEERQAAGKNGGVVGIVMISSPMMPVGWNGHSLPSWPWAVVNGNTWLCDKPEEIFHHDLEPGEAAQWAAMLKPSRDPRSDPASTTYAAWTSIPVNYLICDDDRCLSKADQEDIVAEARESGARITVEHCAASHSPFLSMPGVVTEVIRRAAGETVF